MELTITEVLQNRGRKMQQGLLPALQQKSNEIMVTYGNREKFLATFNPDLQRDLCTNPDVCFFGGAPTLSQLNMTYGSQTAAMWLIPQLYNLSEYCGCKDKLEGNPLKECASVIATEFHFLSVSELMLFFHRFKSGRYGRFYGSIDPLVITSSIRMFLSERMAAYNEHERLMQERKENETQKCTWEEYSMNEYGEIRPNPLDRKPEPRKEEKKKPTEDDIASALRVAEAIIHDPIADNSSRRLMDAMFKKKYGLIPKEYIKKHGNRQDSQPRHAGGDEENWGGQN